MADTIPTELIDWVFSYAVTIDTQTAHAICLTNKSGRGYATPALYQSLYVGNGVEEEDAEEAEGRMTAGYLVPAPRIDAMMYKWSRLCRTMLENRDLARRVRYIDAHLIDIDQNYLLASHSLNHNALLNLIVELADSSSQDRAYWEEYIWDWLEVQQDRARPASRHEDNEFGVFIDEKSPVFGPDVYLAILILACPQLRSLGISGPTTTELRPVKQLAKALISRPGGLTETPGFAFGGFSTIQEVSFQGPGSNWSVPVVGQSLRWPSLKIMTIDVLDGGMRAFPSLGTGFLSTLTTLHITNAIMDMDDLELLLRPCTHLKTFSMSFSDDCDVYRTPQWVVLAINLQYHNLQLEELCINVPPVSWLREVFWDEFSRDLDNLDQAQKDEITQANNQGLGPLTRLTRLRKLSLPFFVMFGVFDDEGRRGIDWTLAEILPGSLEDLQIVCNGVDFTEGDEALLCAAGSEKLRRMKLWNCTRTESRLKEIGESVTQTK